MDIFQFVDRVKPEPCLMNDELYLEKEDGSDGIKFNLFL